MQEIFTLITELGFPVAGGLIMAYFIFLVMKQLMDGLVSEIQTVQAISKMLITRASTMNNDMIRIDQLRLLDQDMIRLQQKVNTVLELKEANKLNEK